jgi:hypothetical protein
MLLQVNGVPVKAFVDSGAQMTIMTHEFAAKCYLTRLLDKRFAGMAVGVGSSRILGRIHQAPLKVRYVSLIFYCRCRKECVDAFLVDVCVLPTRRNHQATPHTAHSWYVRPAATLAETGSVPCCMICM